MPANVVLITGATGFTGSALVDRYAGAGWDVHGTCRRCGDHHISAATFHEIDLMDGPAVTDLVRRVQPVAVLHMAAQSSVALARGDPLDTLAVNAGMQFHVLEAVAEGVADARVLVVGSCEEYGFVAREDNPVREEHPLLPLNPYALSKVAQDLMGYEYYATRRMDVVRVRPFLQIGPRRDDRFVAGSFARQVAEIEAGLRPPVIDVGTVDLERDFTDVRDVANACALVVERGKAGEVYNIASGEPHSLRQMLAILMTHAGVVAEVRSRTDLQRAEEMPLLIGDASRLRRATGWIPSIPFPKSVADTLDDWRMRIAPSGAT